MAWPQGCPGLLDDRLDVEQAGVITRDRGSAGQIQAQIQYVVASAQKGARCNCLTEQLKASTGNTDSADSPRGERGIRGRSYPALHLRRRDEVRTIGQGLGRGREIPDQPDA